MRTQAGAGPRSISLQDPLDLRGWLQEHEGANGLAARVYIRYDDYTGTQYANGKGRRTEMWDISGHTRWTHDQRGRIIKEEKWIDGHCYITEWTYDAMDRILTITYPRTPTEVANNIPAEVVTYSYNDQLLLASITSSVSGNIATEIAYNALELPTQLKLSNATSPDPNLYVRNRFHVLDAGSSSYPFGALWDIRLDKGGVTQFRLQHFYDTARNMTRTIEDGGLDLAFLVDPLDRLTARQITGGATQESFSYNALGNVTSKNGQNFSYGSKPHAVTSDGTQPYAYDNNGNMYQRGTGQYVKYDAENRPAKVTTDLPGLVYVARMAYNGDGQRTKRVDNFGTVHYVGGHYERNVGTGADATETVTKFYRAKLGRESRLVAFRKGSTLYYVVPDHLGSTFRVVDTSGNTVDDIRYHAFGATRSGGTSLQTDRRFTGQTLDSSTGLYFYNARYYDPEIGRFLSPDTVVQDYRNPQSLNRYSYGLNNPVKYTDPTGHFIFLIFAAVAVGFGAYAWLSTPTSVNAPAPGEPLVDSEEWASSKAAATTFPVVGDINDQLAARTGHDFLMGEDVGPEERIAYQAASVLPYVSGSLLIKRGGKLIVDETKGPARMAYKDLKKLTRGTGNVAHHEPEKRFSKILKHEPDDMLGIAAEPDAHQEATRRWRKEIPYSNSNADITTTNATPRDIENAGRAVYSDEIDKIHD